MNRGMAFAAGAVAAVMTAVSPSPAQGSEADALKALVKDEARIAREIALDRNIDAFTAYRMMTTRGTPLVDVRTAQEYQFVGHVPAAYSIPVFLWGKWDEQKKTFGLEPNPEFLEKFSAVFPDKKAPIIVMCRSGHRSGKAIKMLVAAGYSNLYQMWEGFEGIPVSDGDLPSRGKKIVDGWRNKGLPDTWDMNPALVVVR